MDGRLGTNPRAFKISETLETIRKQLETYRKRLETLETCRVFKASNQFLKVSNYFWVVSKVSNVSEVVGLAPRRPSEQMLLCSVAAHLVTISY